MLTPGTPKTLRYFKDEDTARTGKNGGTIEVDAVCPFSSGPGSDPEHPFYFEIAAPNRTYMLSAPSGPELDEWVAACSPCGAVEGNVPASHHCAKERAESTASYTTTGPLVEVTGRVGARLPCRASRTHAHAAIFSPPQRQVHSGWMKKKGQGPALFGGKMQKRYFVLYDNRELHYFEGSSLENIQRKGRIQMRTASSLDRMRPDDLKDFSFIIKVPGRDWILDPGNMASWTEWESKLRPMLAS